MAKRRKKKVARKTAVKRYLKSKGLRLPHGYEVVLRKRRAKKK